MSDLSASVGPIDEPKADMRAMTEEEAIMLAAGLPETELMRDREDILFVVNTWLEESATGAIADFQKWLQDQQRFAYKSGMLRFPGRRPLGEAMVTSLARYLRDRKAIESTSQRQWI